MRRGALCKGSIDFLRTDWFEIAELSVAEAREHYAVSAKAADAIESGSAGPWDPGGISAFQVRSGRALAQSQARSDEAYGASVAPSGS
jgi:hypothetical protein